MLLLLLFLPLPLLTAPSARGTLPEAPVCPVEILTQVRVLPGFKPFPTATQRENSCAKHQRPNQKLIWSGSLKWC